MYILLFFGHLLFCKTFLLYNWILKKLQFFSNFQICLQIPMIYHLSYLDIKHGIYKRGGGVKLTPPPAYPGFQVPQQRG